MPPKDTPYGAWLGTAIPTQKKTIADITPEDIATAMNEADHVLGQIPPEIRATGRPVGQFAAEIKRAMRESGMGAPVVMKDDATGTVTIPNTPAGLMALLAEWDSLFTDMEYMAIRSVILGIVPMGQLQQQQHKIVELEHERHMKEHPWHAEEMKEPVH